MITAYTLRMPNMGSSSSEGVCIMLKRTLLGFVMAVLFISACGVETNVETTAMTNEEAIKFYQALSDQEKEVFGLPQSLSVPTDQIKDALSKIVCCCKDNYYIDEERNCYFTVRTDCHQGEFVYVPLSWYACIQ